MSVEQQSDLLRFLKPFPKEARETALWLRAWVWSLYPESNELIYDNYNAVAFGWSLSEKLGDLFCNVAVGRSSYNVHLGFYWGSKISDPDKILLGKGNQYRYILVNNRKGFPKVYMKKLIKEAYAYSLNKRKVVLPGTKEFKGVTMTKSVSGAKRKPGKSKLKAETGHKK